MFSIIRSKTNNFSLIKKCVFQVFGRHNTTAEKSKNYQNQGASDIPTMHFQSSLPRLPIPDLKQTCKKYLAAVKPLISDSDYSRTKEIVSDFIGMEGAKLQEMLIALDNSNTQTSYVFQPWTDKYLSNRYPLPHFNNALLVIKQDHRHEYNNQLIKTCNCVISALRIMKSIENNSFQPTIQFLFKSKVREKIVRQIIRWAPKSQATKIANALNAIPKDMIQFHRIFGRSRIPEPKRDSTVQYENTRHIIVLKNSRIYSVDVLNEIGEIEPAEVIFDRINHIYQTQTIDENCSIATLTTDSRENWSKLRKYLSIKLENEKHLEQVDSALFCVSIENSYSMNDSEMSKLKLFFSGDGRNRWFDKSLTLAIFVDGTVGVCFEHSWCDGRAMVRLSEELHKDITTSPFITPNSISTNAAKNVISDTFVREITFNVDATIESAIKCAIENHMLKVHSLKLNNFRFTKLNKKVCKNFKLSPDSIAQLGFQLAFYKQHSKFVSTYEPCNTQKFLHGRTDAIRPCTQSTLQFCYAICRKTENNSELMALINNCSRVHRSIVQQSANGHGFDRHLYCLRYLAQENGFQEPTIFQDSSYNILTTHNMVTTTVSANALMAVAFGPHAKDGYGIWYEVADDAINVLMSYYPEHSQGLQYLQLLDESYTEIWNILEKSTQRNTMSLDGQN